MSGIEIKNRWTGATIATGRKGETVRDVVVRVVKEKGSLRGADLRGADLTDADLRSADLTDADLARAIEAPAPPHKCTGCAEWRSARVVEPSNH